MTFLIQQTLLYAVPLMIVRMWFDDLRIERE